MLVISGHTICFTSPFGQMIRPFIDAMSVQPTGGHTLFSDTPPSRSNKATPTTSQPSSKVPPTTRQSQNSPRSKQDKEEHKPFTYSVV
jgi:hypothetical protein